MSLNSINYCFSFETMNNVNNNRKCHCHSLSGLLPHLIHSVNNQHILYSVPEPVVLENFLINYDKYYQSGISMCTF